ncbi:MAG: HAD-IB family phosphatase [Chloroflexi bacterium]|nr:HAD-IB family phosphatase [Chloroflexota bacterium]
MSNRSEASRAPDSWGAPPAPAPPAEPAEPAEFAEPASIVVLVDYDGTIARSDVSDEVMWRHADRDAWAPLEAAYLRGDIGSRTLLVRQAAVLHGDTAEIAAIGDDQELDAHFVPFVGFLRDRSIEVEVVSDGFGFFVGPSLARLGLGDLPVFTARTAFPPGRVEIGFPDGHPTCRVCGTCKRERILVHHRAGRHVVFIGDGFSDLYAAGHADTVFAKDHLAELCADRGWPYQTWSSFADIQAALGELLAAGVPAPRQRPFICGPEVWPAGTIEPLWTRPPAPRTVGGGASK